MLTAEKAHLLLTRPSGRSEAPALHRAAVAAAAIADLRAAGLARVEDAPAQDARVWAVRGGAAGHPVLDALLSSLDRLSGERVTALVAKGRPDARRAVLDHLVEAGELEKRRVSPLETRHVPVSPATRQGLLEHLGAVGRGEAEGTEEDRFLIGLLHQLNVAARLLPAGPAEESRRDAARRLESLTRDDVLVQALGCALTGHSATAAAVAAAGEPVEA